MMTREEWLNNAAKAMKGWVRCAGGDDYIAPLISVGFPKGSRGKSSANAIGQCWDKSVSQDQQRSHIFVIPTMTESVEVMAVLLHELVHASVGTKCGHRGPFRKVAKALGLEGKMTATVPGEALKLKLELLRRDLGDYPHSALKPTVRGLIGSRMLKVECKGCGCIVRMSNKWIESVGTPVCACGEQMEEA
jgi:hypothetical protein